MIFFLVLLSIWTEGFETQNFFPPNDWLIVNEDAFDACWFRVDNEGHNSTHAAACRADTSYAGVPFTNIDCLISPLVIPTQPQDTCIEFWLRLDNTSPCSLDIMVSPVSPPNMDSLVLLQTDDIVDTSWIYKNISLGSYSGIPVHVVFRIRTMQSGQICYLDDITLPDITTQPHICNGRLRTKGRLSQRYLQVWGSHYDMGYAMGYLVGEEAMANMKRFAVGNTSYHYFSPVEYELGALPYFRSHFSVPTKYQDEAQGAYNGCLAKGVDLMHPDLGRDITVEDILCLSALCDFNIFGCSSISGWGQSTINDDTLQGGFIIARDLDFRSGLYTTLGNTGILVACSPNAPGEHDFVIVSMSGFIGCLSGINEKGVGLCCDYGNYPDTSYIAPNSLVPFTFSCRHAIETIDPDSNGIHDIFDIKHAIHDSTSLTSWDIQVFSPYDSQHTIPGAILELNHQGDSMRFTTDNNLPPAIASDWNLVVTNHDRVYHPPVYCYRYEIMAESLNNDYRLDTDRAVAIEDAVAGWSYYAGTIQSIVFRPNIVIDHPDWPCIGVSYAGRNQGAHQRQMFFYSWNELFEGVPGVQDAEERQVSVEKSYATIIRGPLKLPSDGIYQIFDITGRRIEPSELVPGVYFIQRNGHFSRKIIKLR